MHLVKVSLRLNEPPQRLSGFSAVPISRPDNDFIVKSTISSHCDLLENRRKKSEETSERALPSPGLSIERAISNCDCRKKKDSETMKTCAAGTHLAHFKLL